MSYPLSSNNKIDIFTAVAIFSLSNTSSINEIRKKYHDLVKEWHPDVSDHSMEKSHEMIIQIKEAYELLMDYCMNYQISFSPQDCIKGTKKGSMEYWYERFGDDPIWG